MGLWMCITSAVAFGAMAIFAKFAYDDGVSVHGLLLVRFSLAAIILTALAVRRREFRGISRPIVLAGLAMGAVGYAAQASLFFSALHRLDASLVALILYVYPVVVTGLAIVLGRERASLPRLVALAVALAGAVLVIGGAPTSGADPVGVTMALGAALLYSGYILLGDRVAAQTTPLALSSLVCVGAAVTFGLGSLVIGVPALDIGPAAWGWLAALALISTVGAMLLFFAGLARVGPSTAALLSIMEPVSTVGLAALIFHETLTAGQLFGAALVLSAVLVVQWRPRGSRPGPEATSPALSPTEAAAELAASDQTVCSERLDRPIL